jgi:hypothetical protein
MRKRPIKNNIHYLDVKRKNSRNIEKNNTKYFNNLIDLCTNCDVCGVNTTKKNFINDLFMCEECVNLHSYEIYNLVTKEIENEIEKNIKNYIDWDSEDLDSLYNKFWLNDDSLI